MLIKKNKDITNLTAFKTRGIAQKYIRIDKEEDIKELNLKQPVYILGKGYNTLLTKELFKGTILKVNIGGLKVKKETPSYVELEAGSGYSWSKLVEECVNKGWGGIENLAYIPGSIGAAVVQNISAYGGEFQTVFVQAKTIDLNSKKTEYWTKKECKFSYRYSIFKNPEYRNKIITRVTIRLNKNINSINTKYFEKGQRNLSLENYLKENYKRPYTIKNVYEAIIKLRKEKLPEPDEIPSGGSFFINPIIPIKKYWEIKSKFPNLQWYPASKKTIYTKQDLPPKECKKVKIATGQLLDYAGWKGKWINNCGCYYKNASIVITNKKATGKEVLKFDNDLKRDIYKKFGIRLKPEIVFI